MTGLRVSGSADAVTAGDIVPVIASLPVSLARTESLERGDLIALHGGAGWPQRMADVLQDGAQGLLLLQPTVAPVDDVPDVSRVPVVVDYWFSGNPAVSEAKYSFDGWPAYTMIEVAAVLPDHGALPAALLDQLAALRRIGQPAADLTRLTWQSGGYYLGGFTNEGTPLLLSAHVTVGVPPSLRVRGLARDRIVELTLPDPTTARPATLVSTDSVGALTSPTIWETSHRAAWRRLHAAVTGAEKTHDLADLLADLAVASHVLPAP
jgi:hypothetical protein